MAFTGACLTIIYTVLLHFTIVGTNSWIFNSLDILTFFAVLTIQGLVFISYPLIGLLADIKLTRYHMICLSCWILFVCNGISSILAILISTESVSIHYKNISLDVVASSLVALAIVGKGMFESTVIQFGTDQMIEASSNQLSTFIHWYYWSLYIGNVCIDTIITGIMVYLSYCQIKHTDLNYYRDLAITKCAILLLCIPQCCLCCITLLLLYLKKFKNYLNIEPVGVNPVKQIIDVLKYAYHHKYPVRRSTLSLLSKQLSIKNRFW